MSPPDPTAVAGADRAVIAEALIVHLINLVDHAEPSTDLRWRESMAWSDSRAKLHAMAAWFASREPVLPPELAGLMVKLLKPDISPEEGEAIALLMSMTSTVTAEDILGQAAAATANEENPDA